MNKHKHTPAFAALPLSTAAPIVKHIKVSTCLAERRCDVAALGAVGGAVARGVDELEGVRRIWVALLEHLQYRVDFCFRF